MKINKAIFKLAIPSIITNITVPVLGLVDMTIAGHIAGATTIAAIAVGAMMFNLAYWNFAFLRMGTTGLTAQAYGRNDSGEITNILLNSAMLAALIGVAIIILQFPLQWLALTIISPSLEVLKYAQSYFFICIWGAPAILTTMALKGWLLGMQNSKYPMYISISINIINIILSCLAVFVFKLGFIGIAIGTLLAEYIGVILAIYIIYNNYPSIFRMLRIKNSFRAGEISKFFKVNRDIFIRSLCLMSVTITFMAIGARLGDTTLAVNSLIMQLFILFSYFMDGFAFAGEAIVGRFAGEQNRKMIGKAIQRLMMIGLTMCLVFSMCYALWTEEIFGIFTRDLSVIIEVKKYTLWIILIPIVSFAAFIWDGVYIGLTATRLMVISIACATVLFFSILGLSPISNLNDTLWLSFIVYLATRSIAQSVLYYKGIKEKGR